MTFGGSPFAESTLAGTVFALSAAPEAPPIDPIHIPGPEVVIDPYTVEIDGVSYKPLINSLSIDSELGRQGSATFTLVNVETVPLVGQIVRIKWYNQLIFGGMLDRYAITTNNTESFKQYACECVDFSYLLFRRKMRKTYSNVQLITIASQIINGELAGDGVTYGTIDPLAVNTFLDTVDIQDSNTHDVLSECSAAIGAIFFIDYQRRISLTTLEKMPPAPMTIDDTITEDAELSFDRETYRNRQTVTITGTPATQGEAPLTITYTRSNAAQIAERQAVEGTGGVYNDFESITHPTSNNPTQLHQLAVSYALLRLGAQGALRRNLRIRTRATGFAAGQLATVDLPQLGLTGSGSGETWFIQKVRIREESGRFMITTLELTSSSLLRRAQELWLDIVRRGQITVIPKAPLTAPSAITTASFTTPQTTGWVVPAGVTQIQMSCHGGGGGGGGGAKNTIASTIRANGGKGGNGGLAVSVLSVTPGETLTIVVGAGGGAGVSVAASPTAYGDNGLPGGTSSVKRGAAVLLYATGGFGGGGAIAAAAPLLVGLTRSNIPGANGGDGAGIGQINTYGGGSTGGTRGTGSPFAQPTAGASGKVILEY